MRSPAPLVVALTFAVAGCARTSELPVPRPIPPDATSREALAPKPAAVKLESGDYLLEEYAQAIEQGRTPASADAAAIGELRIAKVSGSGDGALRLTAGSFHEGICDLGVDSTGSVSPRGQAEFTAIDPRRFRLACSRSRPAVFRFVGEADTWVSVRLLGGAYVDGEGRRVVFDTSGRARFAGSQLGYSVCLDMKTCQGDTLYLGDATYGYSIHGSQLTLVPSGDARDAGTPAPGPSAWVLTRVGGSDDHVH